MKILVCFQMKIENRFDMQMSLQRSDLMLLKNSPQVFFLFLPFLSSQVQHQQCQQNDKEKHSTNCDCDCCPRPAGIS